MFFFALFLQFLFAFIRYLAAILITPIKIYFFFLIVHDIFVLVSMRYLCGGQE